MQGLTKYYKWVRRQSYDMEDHKLKDCMIMIMLFWIILSILIPLLHIFQTIKLINHIRHMVLQAHNIISILVILNLLINPQPLHIMIHINNAQLISSNTKKLIKCPQLIHNPLEEVKFLKKIPHLFNSK